MILKYIQSPVELPLDADVGTYNCNLKVLLSFNDLAFMVLQL